MSGGLQLFIWDPQLNRVGSWGWGWGGGGGGGGGGLIIWGPHIIFMRCPHQISIKGDGGGGGGGVGVGVGVGGGGGGGGGTQVISGAPRYWSGAPR